MWQLVINGPGYFDTPFTLPSGVTTLGRAEDNDIVLSGDLVSRRHARLHLLGDEVRVEDLGSRNGSRLNGEPFTGTLALAVGDTLTIGENALAVRRPGPEERVPEGELPDVALEGRLLLSRSLRESQVLHALGNLPQRLGARFPSPVEDDARGAVPYQTLLMLYQVAESLTRSGSLADFLKATCDALVEHVGAVTAAVLLRQADGTLSVELARKSGGGTEAHVSRAIVEDALTSGNALVVEEATSDVRFRERESVALGGPGTVVCVPLGLEPPYLGALYVQGPFRVDASLEQLADVATATAHLLAAAVVRFEDVASQALKPPVASFADRLGESSRAEAFLSSLRGSPGQPRVLREHTVSVLHADLAGALERFSPETSAEILHALHVYLFRVVRHHGGLVEGSQGEVVRAIFPRDESAVPEAVSAVRAALELRGAWDEITLERPPGERSPLRAVVSTGTARLGVVGPVDRPDLVVLGEVATLAGAILEEAAPGQVLIDGRTLAGVGVAFEVQPLGERTLGRARAALFEVLEEDFTDPGRAR